jgi:hypothetical protein
VGQNGCNLCSPTSTASTSSRSAGFSCTNVRTKARSGKDHCLVVKSREPVKQRYKLSLKAKLLRNQDITLQDITRQVHQVLKPGAFQAMGQLNAACTSPTVKKLPPSGATATHVIGPRCPPGVTLLAVDSRRFAAVSAETGGAAA